MKETLVKIGIVLILSMLITMPVYAKNKQTTIEEISFNFYFDEYDANESWVNNPQYMVDGNIDTCALSDIGQGEETQLLTGNTFNLFWNFTINRVYIRTYSYAASGISAIKLTPVFDGVVGYDYSCTIKKKAGWTEWFEITDDYFGPSFWNWTVSDIETLDCLVTVTGSKDVYCSYVQIMVDGQIV